jgi:hypothetical protein
MHFEDRILARIGHHATRNEIFAGVAGERLARAMFGKLSTPTEQMAVTVDAVAFAVSLEHEFRLDLDGRFEQGRVTAQGIIRGVGRTPIADAMIEGRLNLVAPRTHARIELLPQQGIALPSAEELDVVAAAAAPEEGRERAQRLAIGRKMMPGSALDDEAMDDLVGRWIARNGFADSRHLVEALGPPFGASVGMRLHFSTEGPDDPDADRNVSFRAALLVRGHAIDGPWLMDTLREIRAMKQALATQQQLLTSGRGGLELRDPAPVILCVPQEVFSDKDWPGQKNDTGLEQWPLQRATAAAEWLVQEGIALVPLKSSPN